MRAAILSPTCVISAPVPSAVICARRGKEAPPASSPKAPPVAVDTAEVVGRYALNFRWNDGHSTGIYAFNLLRDRCPCGRCVPETDLSAEGEALERESREKNSSLWAD